MKHYLIYTTSLYFLTGTISAEECNLTEIQSERNNTEIIDSIDNKEVSAENVVFENIDSIEATSAKIDSIETTPEETIPEKIDIENIIPQNTDLETTITPNTETPSNSNPVIKTLITPTPSSPTPNTETPTLTSTTETPNTEPSKNEEDNAEEEEYIRQNLSEAKFYLKQKAYCEAIEIYRGLIAEYPDNADYYLFLGQAYKQAGCLTLAIDTLTEGLTLKPDYLDLKNALGYTYMLRGMHTEKTWSHYRWFWQYPYMFYIIPEEIRYRLNLCDINKSEQFFLEVLQDDPKNISALTGLGRIETLRDNRITAENYYCLALNSRSENLNYNHSYNPHSADLIEF